MVVAYDATGSGSSGATSGATAESHAHTATLGADVFLAIEINFSGAPSNVQYNGNLLTLLGSQNNNNAANVGGTYLYRGAGMGTGSSANFTYTIPATTWYTAQSVSYTGVGLIGVSAPIYAYGSSTSLSSGSIAVGAGSMALCAYGSSGGPSTMSGPNGGTNRSLTHPSSAYANLAINDSTSTVTFTGTLSSSSTWSSVVVVLSPPPGSGWLGPVAIPNPKVGPMALRQQKRWPYSSFVNPGSTPPVAFDQSGSGFVGASFAGTTGTWTDYATQGSYVVAAIHCYDNVTNYGGVTAVTYGGRSMTPLYTVYNANNFSFGQLTFYGLANAPGGQNTVQFTLATASNTASSSVIANSFSYTGVNSVSPFAWPSYGSGTALSSSVTNVASGVVLQAFSGVYNLTGLTGGNIRCNLNLSNNLISLAVQDTSTAGSTVFSATQTTSSVWGGIGMVLSPNPSPTYPAAFSAALTKFANQQNVTLFGIGDSTLYGAYDTVTGGWFSRFGIILGNYYDYNVNVQMYTTAGGGSYQAPVVLRASPRGAGAPTLLLYNGGVPGTQIANDLIELLTENLVPIANPDCIFVNDAINDADAGGVSPTEFTVEYTTLLGYLTNVYCPGVPIIATTENTIGGTMSSHLAALQANIGAMTQALVGQGIPLGAALVQNVNTNVSVLDTQQAYLYQWQSSLMTVADPVHPNPWGYAREATWVAATLAPWTVDAIGASRPPLLSVPNPMVGPMALRNKKRVVQPSYVTLQMMTDTPSASANILVTGGVPSEDQEISSASGTVIVAGDTPSEDQGVSPGTSTVSVAGGTSSEDQGVNPPDGSVVVTGGTPSEGGSVDPASASMTVAGGVPSENQRVVPGTGTVTTTGGVPSEDQKTNPADPSHVVVTGATPSEDQGVSPDSASIEVTGGVVVESQGASIDPPSASITVTGGASPGEDQTINPPSDGLHVVSGVPSREEEITPNAGAHVGIEGGTPILSTKVTHPVKPVFPLATGPGINLVEPDPARQYGPDMFFVDQPPSDPTTELNTPLPRAWSQGGIIESVKRAVMNGMREAFELTGTDNIPGKFKIDIEYPMSPQDLPGIWVQFSIDSMQRGGLDMGVATQDANGNWGEIRTWVFNGKITLTCAALSSLDRDRLSDTVIAQLAFARNPDLVIRDPRRDAKQFKGLISALNNNPYVSMTLNTDQVLSGGQTVTNSIPWATNKLLYEDNYTVTCHGQFNMRFSFDGIYELTEIDLLPTAEINEVAYNPFQWRGQAPSR